MNQGSSAVNGGGVLTDAEEGELPGTERRSWGSQVMLRTIVPNLETR